MDTLSQPLSQPLAHGGGAAPRAAAQPRALEAGRAWPLGASVDGDGVNFAVVSAQATRIELCLFDADGERELARAPLPARSGCLRASIAGRPWPAAAR